FDDLLDNGHLVPRENRKSRWVRADLLVRLDGHDDALDARVVGALAHPLRDGEHVAERLVEALDALVDLPEERLVLRRARRAVAQLRHLVPPLTTALVIPRCARSK